MHWTLWMCGIARGDAFSLWLNFKFWTNHRLFLCCTIHRKTDLFYSESNHSTMLSRMFLISNKNEWGKFFLKTFRAMLQKKEENWFDFSTIAAFFKLNSILFKKRALYSSFLFRYTVNFIQQRNLYTDCQVIPPSSFTDINCIKCVNVCIYGNGAFYIFALKNDTKWSFSTVFREKGNMKTNRMLICLHLTRGINHTIRANENENVKEIERQCQCEKNFAEIDEFKLCTIYAKVYELSVYNWNAKREVKWNEMTNDGFQDNAADLNVNASEAVTI